MDFIKTSSLRALIELTFQRNWNGLIWMSRKGVTTKRVKTVQTALSRISAQPRSPAGRGTNVPRSAKSSVRLKSRPKSKTGRDQSRPGKLLPAVGHATTTPRRARPKRASRENASRPRNSSRVPRPMRRPSRETTSRVRPRFHRPIFIRPTTAADHASVRPRPFRLGHDPIPADRPDRPSQRRGRPEARFEAHFIFSSPA
ncbi:unnamed protein product [Microthlaspi erraticum]|uniref:Uncharacterized protein n=1 Tax=Microthlaspi erraticum TaxID=1685480 RepID=A0A6D2J1U0_9BRAS|nr:unnamed protein product [Microthlaspi erraticum]